MPIPNMSTFVCPTEIIAFSDRFPEFKNLNVAVLACSTDSVFSHLAWINTPRKHGGLGDMKIPVLADTNHQIAKDYGVLKDDEGIAYRATAQFENDPFFERYVSFHVAIGKCMTRVYVICGIWDRCCCESFRKCLQNAVYNLKFTPAAMLNVVSYVSHLGFLNSIS
ncbi:hypothetical protein Y032_0142g2349 [Ancylostoma ceylanicum]|uniref:thioredoxin-dependent peroxiredoxin n=1 Tax=Ancylostoma ceylanicum TaxID=53326 RepID=A0A016T3V4_9BILA|nr:hypothetical protein Y032_0142g2349 [Ancylostoma ceylanicum]